MNFESEELEIKYMINYRVFIIFLLLTGVFVAGCSRVFQLPLDAEGAYESKQYIKAGELFIEEYKTESSLVKQAELATKIGECFRLANQTDKAESWYAKALDYSYDPATTYKYGRMLKANGKYDKAIKIFKSYSVENPSDRTRAAREIQACKLALVWEKESKETNYVIDKLSSLNSSASDFAPAIFGKDQLVFTSAREEATGETIYGWTGEKHSDLFVSQLNKKFTFAPPVLFGDSINTEFNEGTISFSSDYKTAFFTACGGRYQRGDDFCQLYKTKQNENGKWGVPEIVDLFESDTINVGQPFLSPDGKQLYFSADAPSGFGDKDLYVVEMMRDGFWGEPKNLGPEINTDGYEGFPHIGIDGNFYFASNGHTGMGGLDIFYAEWKEDKWTNPVNMKAPVNSPADDFSFVFNPNIDPELLDSIEYFGYFSSSRKGGKGNDDIYQFTLLVPQPEPPKPDTTPVVTTPNLPPLTPAKPKVRYVLQGKVQQKVLEDPTDPNSVVVSQMAVSEAISEVLGLSSGSSMSRRIVSSRNGLFSASLEPETDYKVTASKVGYFTQSKNVSTKGKSPTRQLTKDTTIYIYADFLLDKIYKQQNINITQLGLEPIYYDLDKWDIRDDAKPTLNKLATILFENPGIVIEMGSHTDSRGSDSYNQKLSQKRAQSVIDYLSQKGIAAQRLIAKGYGETQLVNRCNNGVDCSEEEHQENRRTTFKVVDDRFKGF